MINPLLSLFKFSILQLVAIEKEKIRQACGILAELDIDVWLIFVRETRLQADPAMALITDGEATWPSYFLFTRMNEAFALVGNFDEEIFKAGGCFTEVRSYTEGVGAAVRTLLCQLDPQTIAINYSRSDPSADGLTHGMYLLLLEHLDGTPYCDRLVSGETVMSKLRSRKLPIELERLTAAAEAGIEIWQEAAPRISLGMTEIQIAGLIDSLIGERGGVPSFDTIVNAGDKSSPGHGKPTGAALSPGDLLHVDFGVQLQGYCSDLQRLIYFPGRNERHHPAELTDAFDMVVEIISRTGEACRPGKQGWEIDGLAREILRDHGYPEYQHALGHQLGMSVHDGGAIIGPQWARYGGSPRIELEENNVFTLELEIMLPGIGCVGLEEDVCVTATGARFLCPRQVELAIR